MTTNQYTYTTITDVPHAWRKLEGAPLSLEQINRIYGTRAAELAEEKGLDNPDYGTAKVEFRETHEIRDGLWVPKDN